MASLETSRLKLELITTKDAAFLHRLMNQPSWFENIGDKGVPTVEATKKYIENHMHHDLDVKGFVNYLITVKATGEKVGTCSLHNRPWVPGYDIGYALLTEYEGYGYAKEAAQQMVQLAFGHYLQKSVGAITNVSNVASQALLMKLGFKAIGEIPVPNSEASVMHWSLSQA